MAYHFNRIFGAAVVGVVILGGCEPDPTPVAEISGPAPNASAESSVANAPVSPLIEYSRNLDSPVSLSRDSVLFSFFCKAIEGGECEASTQSKLTLEGFVDGQTVSDLAYAAVVVKAKRTAAENASSPSVVISDEQFVNAAYVVVLGRMPDPMGLKGNLDYLSTSNDRKGVVRAIIGSPEFQQRQF